MENLNNNLKQDFPIFKQKIFNKNLVYLDTAASAQKPKIVLDAMTNFYENNYSNIHRGVHSLSVRATDLYEQARERVRKFIGAEDSKSIIFTKGTTESLNLLAQSLGLSFLKPGDRILLTRMEHHSNIVPWQMLRERLGIEIDVWEINLKGELDLENLEKYLTPRTKLISMAHISNVLGLVNPVKEIIKIAHEKNILVCLDAAQSISHMTHEDLNVKNLDADFLVFSGHKLYGPTGIGVLYGKLDLLEKLTPAFGGGSMIESVSFEKTSYTQAPLKFEAGTPPIAEAIGLAAAMDYLDDLGLENLVNYEHELTQEALKILNNISGLKIYGESKNKIGVISFNVDGIHAHDLGTLLDQEGVAIRAGHHCAMPLMNFYKVPAMNRMSLGIYNDLEDVEKLAAGIIRAKKIFGV